VGVVSDFIASTRNGVTTSRWSGEWCGVNLSVVSFGTDEPYTGFTGFNDRKNYFPASDAYTEDRQVSFIDYSVPADDSVLQYEYHRGNVITKVSVETLFEVMMNKLKFNYEVNLTSYERIVCHASCHNSCHGSRGRR
jgi:hypothetical protein